MFNKSKVKNLSPFFLALAIFIFIIYIAIKEKQFEDRHISDLENSARITSRAVWTLYTESSVPYLHQIMEDRHYLELIIRLNDGTNIIDFKQEQLNRFEQFLERFQLVRTVKFQTDIIYNKEKLGEMQISAYNLNFYSYMNTLLIMTLIVIILWFAIQVYHSKNELEMRVNERTRELDESRKRLDVGLSASKSGIWDWYVSEGLVYFDDNYYRIAGYEPQAFPASFKEWEARVHPEDLDKTLNIIEKCFNKQANYFTTDFRFRRADGSWMWILALGKIIEENADGSARRFIGTHTDISDYKKLADELKKSEDRYFSLFNNNHAIMLLIDPESGRIADANPAAIEFYGYTKDELTAKSAHELNTLPAEEVTKLISKACSGNKNIFEFKHVIASGEIIDVEAFAGPIDFKGKSYLFSIVHDITKRKKAEDELNEFNKNLQNRVKEEVDKNRKQEEIIHNQKKLVDIGNMISAISHQWRQPLNALGMYVQDIFEAFSHEELDKKYIENFEKTSMDIINHMSATIDDFRYFYMPDKEASDMRVLEEIYSLLRLTLAQIRNNHITVVLTCECKDDTFTSVNLDKTPECDMGNSTVRGYKGEFKQVVANLIYNSIDAIKTYGADGFIRVSVQSDHKNVTIRIYDNGGGIPDNVADKIFLPYFSTKTASKGTGIGLYMSKMIIEEHMNGRIWFENEGEGVTFVIELPKSKGTPNN